MWPPSSATILPPHGDVVLRVMHTGDLSESDARDMIVPGAIPLFDLHRVVEATPV
jgi:hypothetical protein